MTYSDVLGKFFRSGASSSGGRGGFFNLTKDRTTATIWLHRKHAPERMFMHQFPTEVQYTDKDGNSQTSVISEDVLCSGPKSCHICKLVEYVRNEVLEGRLDVRAPVMRIERRGEVLSYPAAIFAGLFDAKKHPDIFEAGRKAGLSPHDSFKYVMTARPKWVTLLVDQDNVDGGLQLARFSSQLGDSILKCVEAAIQGAADESEGNPFENPYPFKITYNPAAKIPTPSYSAIVLSTKKVPLTEQVSDLLVAEAPQNYLRATSPANPQKLAASVERFFTIPVPMAQIFGSTPATQVEREEFVSLRTPAPSPVAQFVVTPTTIEPVQQARRVVKPAEAPPPAPVAAVKELPCEVCGKPFDENATQCPHCGTSFELQGGSDFLSTSDIPF